MTLQNYYLEGYEAFRNQLSVRRASMYSWVSNTRGGSNKRVDWNSFLNLISGEALITAGRVEKFSFV